MGNDSIYKTRTMARIQEEQGRWEEAAEIYRYLLEQDPDDGEVANGLERVLARLNPKDSEDPSRLENLFFQWVELLLCQKQTDRLKSIQERLRH